MRELIVDVVGGGGPHHLRHALAIREALPPEMRGSVWTYKQFLRGAQPKRTAPPGRADLYLVSSYIDMRFTAMRESKAPIIFTEHGAGFSFANSDGVTYGSYSGSLERPNVELFLNTNEYVQRRNAAAHPYAAQAIVGCPAMDSWYPPPQTPHQRGEGPLRIGLSFHWDCLVSPGTRSAFRFYRDAIPGLAQWCADQGYELVLTAHPRIETDVQMSAMTFGIPYISLDEVFRTADVLAFDATSAGYEFASLDRPVVVLEAPYYAHEATEGIRFFEHLPGIRVNGPDELIDGVAYAITDQPEVRYLRDEAVEAVYPIRGNAATTAAEAIRAFTRARTLPNDFPATDDRLSRERARAVRTRDLLLSARNRGPRPPLDDFFEYTDVTRERTNAMGRDMAV